VKVLKKGSGAKSWSKKVTCTGNGNGGGGCKAKLLIEKTDLFHTFHSSYDGDTDIYTTFICPECKVMTDIGEYCVPDDHDLPSFKTWKERKGKREKATK